MSTSQKIDRYAAAVCDGTADEAMLQDLAAVLRDNPDAQMQYLASVDLHNSLRWMTQGDAVAGAVSELKTAGVQPGNPSASRLRLVGAILVAVAALVVAFLLGNRSGSQGPTDDETTVTGSKPPANIVPMEAVPSGSVWATVAESADGHWLNNGELSPRILREGLTELHEGVLRVRLASGVHAVFRAPARFRSDLEDGIHLNHGHMVLTVPGAEATRVRAGSLSALVAKSTLGVSVDESISIAGGLSGETVIDISKEVTGRPEQLVLRRGESVRAMVRGGMIADIVGDVARFQELEMSGAEAGRLVANASFEYPIADVGQSDLAATGWSFQVLPLMNAGVMPRDHAVGMLSATRDAAVAPPNGKQWAFLGAERLADGRYFHAAMHQRIGLLKRDVTYRLGMTIAAAPDATKAVPCVIGLYAGQPDSVPEMTLEVVQASLDINEKKEIVLHYRSANTNLYAGMHLFVRAELLPSAEVGTTKVLIDDVKLDVVEGDSAP